MGAKKTAKKAAKKPAKRAGAKPARKAAKKPAAKRAKSPAKKAPRHAPAKRKTNAPTKRAAPKPKARAAAPAAAAAAPARAVIVPDTSVLVDGRLTRMVQRGDLADASILVPLAAVAELEYQANLGKESGFNGLDEIVKLQDLKVAARLDVAFAGERPLPEEIEHAAAGELDAMIRDVAREEDALLFTSDRVQAHVARAMALNVRYIRPITEAAEKERDVKDLALMRYFTDDTMSVHLKYKVPPMAKRGTPRDLKLVTIDAEPMELKALTEMRREIIEAAQRDADSFIEIERHGATVVQLKNMRISIAQPPFSDGLEITAVRPVTKLGMADYDLPQELRERLLDYQRGVFVSGPPGSGKSTFGTAVAEWLRDRGTIVKTMESPRDLQVGDDITQYAPLDRDMALTSDVLLLVRPDFVVYDEVRKTADFEIFADMRLAGVGLVGVTHANRAIDAVQRLVGRVELGMIPQVVDTVIHIEKGGVQQVLDLSFTVKTPFGMKDADLARPVIEVRDFGSGKVVFELYSYGEQVVVMPVTEGRSASPRDKLAAQGMRRTLARYVEGRFEVEFSGDASITLLAEEREIPRIIGKGGRGVQQMEDELGVKIDVRPLAGRGAPDWADRRGGRRGPSRGPQDRGAVDDDDLDAPEPERRYATLVPELRRSKRNVVLITKRDLAGQQVAIAIDDVVAFEATVGARGEVRLSRSTDEGLLVMDAVARGAVVTLRV